MRKASLFICLSLIIFVANAQIFEWSGEWDIWDAMPRNSTVKLRNCCIPESIEISQHGKRDALVDVRIEFDEAGRKNCPEIDSDILELKDQDIKFGLFEDVDKDSPLTGSRALFRPNNNTIQFNPGVYGNCIWILGNENSIITNSSAPHRGINWEGVWDFDFDYPVIEGNDCCEPDYPVHIEEDKKNKRVRYDLFVSDTKCPPEYMGLTHFDMSVDGGAFLDPTGGKGFLLQNGSMLIEWGLCVTALKKISDPQMSMEYY